MITDILDVLTHDELAQLDVLLKKNDSQPYQLIAYSRKGNSDKAWLIKKMTISESSYFKNLTLARDILYGLIKNTQSVQFADIMLVRRLYLRGLYQRSLELYHKLEKEYEVEQLWNALDILHHEAVRIYYTRCDIKMLRQINRKVEANIDRYAVYTKLDKELLLEMALLEKGEMTHKETSGFETRVAKLLPRALKLNHHVLIFNALRCNLEVYTRLNISVDKAQKTVADMVKLTTNKAYQLNPHTRKILFLNAVSFYSMFTTPVSPEKYVGEVFPLTGKFGQLDMHLLFAMVCYYGMQGDTAKFEEYYTQLQQYPLDSDAGYMKQTAACFKHYLHNDFKAFTNSRNSFYQAYDNRAYLDYDLMIRFLELLYMLRDKNFAIWGDKVSALEKFTRRNFTAQRFEIEKGLIRALRQAAQGKVPQQPKPVYRFHQWAYGQLSSLA